MIDFKKKLANKNAPKKINPIDIYEDLDRASDKGPLRPAQTAILEKWYKDRRDEKDIIVKLHTGQGKTLIGLLILQSKLNDGNGPALYLCPNLFLVDQTCEQARQFGIKFCRVDANNQIPREFFDSQSILIITAQLLFNGMTKFGLDRNAEAIGSIVLDDSHACIEAISEAFTIKIQRKEDVYNQILTLFEDDLDYQGSARLEEIRNRSYETFLPVPYWAWQDKIKEVIKLLVHNHDKPGILFPWALVKDSIHYSVCIISGNEIEITPTGNHIERFRSFLDAKCRIFMSATTNNDSYLIKGLGISSRTINEPLKYENERWSGEKMILVPYLMHEELNRSTLVNFFAKPRPKGKFGIVAITPSRKASDYWKSCGALAPSTKEINEVVKALREGEYHNTVAITNRYDGIDLPDDSCRVLIIDAKPFSRSLIEAYEERCRPSSDVLDIKLAQKIEQGLGRGVRGEKDYCIIIFSSPDLINRVRNSKLKRYFSAQTNKQIEIGLEVAGMATTEATSNTGLDILIELMNQVLKRDEGWKQYYSQSMDEIIDEDVDKNLLQILQLEKEAEDAYQSGHAGKAIEILQTLIDKNIDSSNLDERGWYLQEMARYKYVDSKIESNSFQIDAHKLNRSLLRPKHGMTFQKLKVNNNRVENIQKWIGEFESYEELDLALVDYISNLTFGTKADRFEKALHSIGQALGFECERPDHDWKEGPDNLWVISNGNYLLIECKNEVDDRREEIYKGESGQMNNSCGWFKNNYNTESFKAIMIFPSQNVSKAAAFNSPVEIMRKRELNKLKNNIKSFFGEFKSSDLKNISAKQINEALNTHHLTEDEIINNYSVPHYQRT